MSDEKARSLVVLAVTAAVLTGCSITSTSNPLPAHCVKAHDEFHDDGNGGPAQDHVVTICDQYDQGKP